MNLLRRRDCWFLFLLFLLPFSIIAADQSSPQVLGIPVSEIRPTQMEIGLAGVRAIEQANFIDPAIGDDPTLADYKSDPATGKPPRKALPQLTPELRARLRARLKSYVTAHPPRPVRALRGPDGSYYITDGHHRASALELLTEEGRPPLLEPDQAFVRISVEPSLNFMGRAIDFEKAVATKGYYVANVRQKYQRGQLTAKDEVALLPKTMAELVKHDNPLRSVIGRIFFDLGVHGEHYSEYLEFYVGEKISCRVGASPGHEDDDVVLERARRAILEDSTVRTFMKGMELPGRHSAEAEAEVSEATQKFKDLEEARRRQGLLPVPLLSNCDESKPERTAEPFSEKARAF